MRHGTLDEDSVRGKRLMAGQTPIKRESEGSSATRVSISARGRHGVQTVIRHVGDVQSATAGKLSASDVTAAPAPNLLDDLRTRCSVATASNGKYHYVRLDELEQIRCERGGICCPWPSTMVREYENGGLYRRTTLAQALERSAPHISREQSPRLAAVQYPDDGRSVVRIKFPAAQVRGSRTANGFGRRRREHLEFDVAAERNGSWEVRRKRHDKPSLCSQPSIAHRPLEPRPAIVILRTV
jgi:hypothetical protein